MTDLVYALYSWAPLKHAPDHAPSLVDADIPERARTFADGYGRTEIPKNSPSVRQMIIGNVRRKVVVTTT
jgi:hypothetical protein